MGCGASIHPSIYNETSKANGIKPKEKPTQPLRAGDPRQLKGDYSQLQVTRHERNMLIKGIRSKTFIAANEMSGKIIEEREMLSLGTRSRGTSRNTSRAASPTQTKKMLQNSEDKKLPMPPVTESRATSNMSNRSKGIDGGLAEDAKDDTKITVEKGKKKNKKHKVKSKNKMAADVNQNVYHNDENEPIPNDVSATAVTDSKGKPKKTSGKQKAKHRKHKKHKKSKSNMIEEISDAETKGDDEDSADELISNVAEANKTEDQLNTSKDDKMDQNIKDTGILNDLTNIDHTLRPPVPGTVTHVHFSDDITPHSRTSSISELDTKRG